MHQQLSARVVYRAEDANTWTTGETGDRGDARHRVPARDVLGPLP